MKRRGSLAVALTVLVCAVAGDNSICEDHRTCSKCISVPSCIWCSDPNITSVAVDGKTLLHCISNGSSNIDKFRDACNADIYDPPTVMIPEDPDPPYEYLNPQRVKLKIRAGASYNITINYKHQTNYPMDLYCLLDGSKSMTELKSTLASVTNELVKGLNNMTTNLQLGFGMFVDKPVLPYTDMNLWKRSSCVDCTETFSFKNILPLTTNQTVFENKVSSTPGSTNTDMPEGTLDALMQVASCRKEVGWREEALKVVVVFTDAGFHLAGDGKLAGIVKPNDRRCHLDGDGSYTHSVWQDYPSVSELKSVLKDNNVTSTFAVSKELVSLYQLLAEQLYRSSCSEMESYSDIVNLIVEPVRDMISTVTLKPDESIPEIDVKVFSQCKNGPLQDTDTCKDMLSGDTAEFTLNIKIKECPAVHQQTLNFPLGAHSQNFVLDLELLCQCQCDVGEGEVIHDAPSCTNQGDLKCGVCDCYEGFSGNKCHCKDDDVGNQNIDEENCLNPNATNAGICSGQGRCFCGQCKCNEREHPEEVISGRYCQCTNFHQDCRGNTGEICSGHGKCDCNKCKCNDGWGGSVCSCSSSKEDCTDSNGGICSNHGVCKCNRCECDESYEGKHCESCKFCDEKCKEHQPCTECLVFEEGTYAGPACEGMCSSYDITIISDMSENYGYLCSGVDGDDCSFLYQFKENGTQVLVWAQKQKECPTVINPWIIVGGVLAGVVLVGILLLIAWKIITTIKDRREYARFELEKESARWNDNVSPLYRNPKVEITNPLYGQQTD